LLRSGMPTSDVATHFGVTQGAIRNVACKGGVSLPGRTVLPPRPQKTAIVYAAGVFDGEGCVTLNKFSRTTPGHYWLAASVCNTNRRLMNWLKTTLVDTSESLFGRLDTETV